MRVTESDIVNPVTNQRALNLNETDSLLQANFEHRTTTSQARQEILTRNVQGFLRPEVQIEFERDQIHRQIMGPKIRSLENQRAIVNSRSAKRKPVNFTDGFDPFHA